MKPIATIPKKDPDGQESLPATWILQNCFFLLTLFVFFFTLLAF